MIKRSNRQIPSGAPSRKDDDPDDDKDVPANMPRGNRLDGCGGVTAAHGSRAGRRTAGARVALPASGALSAGPGSATRPWSFRPLCSHLARRRRWEPLACGHRGLSTGCNWLPGWCGRLTGVAEATPSRRRPRPRAGGARRVAGHRHRRSRPGRDRRTSFTGCGGTGQAWSAACGQTTRPGARMSTRMRRSRVVDTPTVASFLWGKGRRSGISGCCMPPPPKPGYGRARTPPSRS